MLSLDNTYCLVCGCFLYLYSLMLKGGCKELNLFSFLISFTEGHVTKASGAEGEMGEASRQET